MRDLSKLERAFLTSMAVNVLLILALGLIRLDLHSASMEMTESQRIVGRAGRSLRKCERITSQYHKMHIKWGEICLRPKEKKKIKKAASSAFRKSVGASTRGGNNGKAK